MKTPPSTAVVRACFLVFALTPGCTHTNSPGFDTPDQAMLCVAEVADSNAQSIDRCIGRGASDLFASENPSADREDARELTRRIKTGVVFEDVGPTKTVALLGPEQWPFPIPLVRENGRWRFDLAAAREEMIDRRIGHNELWTIETAHEYVAAQREYRAQYADRIAPAYAGTLISSAGRRDGLYWPRAAEQPTSPVGPALAFAALDECRRRGLEQRPFHGYYYRVLCERGAHAPGGYKSYCDEEGRLTGGFALLAWPAEYGTTGVMTFQVDDHGVVFQKDLGQRTEKLVECMRSYDPDGTWEPTED
jgi:hypothetical protein